MEGNIVMRTRTKFITGAAVLLIAGCGSAPAQHAASTPQATPSASPTTSAPPGPQAFLNDVRKAGLGDKDVQGASDKLLLHIGALLCDALDSGVGYQGDIRIMQGNHHSTVKQATIWVDSAVRNLCPAHLDEIPAGAP
jgi:hypothetical protein